MTNFVRNFKEDLSVISDLFSRVVITPVEETVRRKFATAQEDLADLKKILKAKFSLRRRK